MAPSADDTMLPLKRARTDLVAWRLAPTLARIATNLLLKLEPGTTSGLFEAARLSSIFTIAADVTRQNEASYSCPTHAVFA
jgi:hypothetical protein